MALETLAEEAADPQAALEQDVGGIPEEVSPAGDIISGGPLSQAGATMEPTPTTEAPLSAMPTAEPGALETLRQEYLTQLQGAGEPAWTAQADAQMAQMLAAPPISQSIGRAQAYGAAAAAIGKQPGGSFWDDLADSLKAYSDVKVKQKLNERAEQIRVSQLAMQERQLKAQERIAAAKGLVGISREEKQAKLEREPKLIKSGDEIWRVDPKSGRRDLVVPGQQYKEMYSRLYPKNLDLARTEGKGTPEEITRWAAAETDRQIREAVQNRYLRAAEPGGVTPAVSAAPTPTAVAPTPKAAAAPTIPAGEAPTYEVSMQVSPEEQAKRDAVAMRQLQGERVNLQRIINDSKSTITARESARLGLIELDKEIAARGTVPTPEAPAVAEAPPSVAAPPTTAPTAPALVGGAPPAPITGLPARDKPFEAGREAGAKKIAEKQAEDIDKRILGPGRAAEDTIVSLQPLKILKPSTGIFADWRIKFGGLLDQVGIGGEDVKKAADLSSADAILKGLGNRILTTFAGVQTASDEKRVAAELPSIKDIGQRYHFMVTYLEAGEKRKRERANFYQDWSERKGDYSGVDKAWQKHNSDAPLIAKLDVKGKIHYLGYYDFVDRMSKKYPDATREELVDAWKDVVKRGTL